MLSVQSIIIIVGIVSFLAATALLIYHVIKRERELQQKEKASFDKYEEIIKRAHKEAEDLLDKTVRTSAQLIAQTKGTNETLASDFDKVLQKIAQKQIEALNSEAATLKQGYQEKVTQMESAIDQNTHSMIQEAETSLDKQLATFTHNLISQATQSEQMIGKKTQEMLAQVEAEVAEYKKNKLATIDQRILDLIQKTYHDIIGKSIPPEIHLKLIVEALEKSKKEGVFNL